MNVLEDLKQRVAELVPTLEEASREVVVLLQRGDIPRGLAGLRELLEALQHFHEGLEILILADRHSEYGRFATLKAELEAVYPSVLSALEADDTVALADVLEYELAEVLAEHNMETGSD